MLPCMHTYRLRHTCIHENLPLIVHTTMPSSQTSLDEQTNKRTHIAYRCIRTSTHTRGVFRSGGGAAFCCSPRPLLGGRHGVTRLHRGCRLRQHEEQLGRRTLQFVLEHYMHTSMRMIIALRVTYVRVCAYTYARSPDQSVYRRPRVITACMYLYASVHM